MTSAVRKTARSKRRIGALLLVAGLLVLAGCSGQHDVAPVEGKVTYNGAPLKFGTVAFQPETGPRATGDIQPDGTFRLSTYAPDDGAVLGKHRVTVVCAEHQNPQAAKISDPEGSFGRPLIPQKYYFPETSGLEAEVREHNDPFVFSLSK